MFAILAYEVSLNSAALTQLNAVPDTNFSIRNNNWIFTEQYDLCAVSANGATIAAAQIYDSTLNAINIPQIFPTMTSLTVPSNPNVMDLRHAPIALPMNEEIQMQAANSAGGAEVTTGLIWLKPSGGGAVDYPIQRGTLANPRVLAVCTASIVLTAGSWSPFVGFTFTNPLKGGAYQLNGLEIVCNHGIAYKVNFVKAPLYQGRKMYPGSLVNATYGNNPLRFGSGWMGGLGRFNNFELPQISVLGGTSTGATTYTFYADLTYLGTTGADALP